MAAKVSKKGAKKAHPQTRAKPKAARASASKAAVPKRKRPAVGKSKLAPAKSAIVATLAGVTHAQFAAGGRALLIARGAKKTVALYDLEAADETPPLPTASTFAAVALSADNRFLATGTSTGILAVQSTQTGKTLWKTKATGAPVGELTFTLDGALLIAVGPPDAEGDHWLRVHRAATGEEEKGFDPVPGALCAHLALSPDGVFLAHGELHGSSVLVWHLPTRQVAACIRLHRHRGKITDLAFGVNVRHLFIAQEREVTGWNAENGLHLVTLAHEGDSHAQTVAVDRFASVALVNASAAVVTTRIAGDGAVLEVWGPESGRLRKAVTLGDADIGALATSADGSLLALPGKKECWVWRVDKLLA